jgi:hypothetical protein
MKKKDSESLYLFVNSKANMDALHFYMNLRVEELKEQLVHARDMDTITRFQGAIAELKRLASLREEVNNPKD